ASEPISPPQVRTGFRHLADARVHQQSSTPLVVPALSPRGRFARWWAYEYQPCAAPLLCLCYNTHCQDCSITERRECGAVRAGRERHCALSPIWHLLCLLSLTRTGLR